MTYFFAKTIPYIRDASHINVSIPPHEAVTFWDNFRALVKASGDFGTKYQNLAARLQGKADRIYPMLEGFAAGLRTLSSYARNDTNKAPRPRLRAANPPPKTAWRGPTQYRWHRKDAPASHLCLLYTSPSPRDATLSRMPSSA